MRRLGLPAAATTIVLLLAAWMMSTRPFAAPDEFSHYLRAVTLADGHLLGPRAIYPGPLSVPAAAFVAHNSRAADVPTSLVPVGTECVPTRPGRCPAVTPTGSYAPPEYLLPAIVLTQADDSTTALWLTRLVSSALCAVLLLVGLRLTPGGPWARVGFALALSPMVFFVCSVLNSSALEVAAATCFLVTLLRLAREADRVRGGLWVAVTASGALTTTTFQAGPLFAGVALLIGAVLLGRGAIRRLACLEAAACGLVLLAALTFWYGWGQTSGSGYADVHVLPLAQTFSLGLPWLAAALRDAVGTFGAMSIPLPRIVVWSWWVLVLLGLAGALAVGSARERCALVLACVIAFLAPIFLYAWVQMNSGFGLQGRYVLPLFMVIPLLSGHVLARRLRPRTPIDLIAYAIVATVVALQTIAWLYDAHRNAGTPAQPLGFRAANAFVPPLGWAVCAGLVVLAGAIGLAIATMGAVSSLRRAPAAGR